MNKNSKIIICGGGLVGSLQALLLGQRGYQVTVIEKRPDSRKTNLYDGRSINLALAVRGSRPLELAGVMEKVDKILIPMKGRMIHELEKEPFFSPYSQNPEDIVFSVSRADLNEILLTEGENTGNVHYLFECEPKHIDLVKKEINLAHGDPLTYDVLIGADGGGSIVRRTILEAHNEENETSFLEHQYKELTIPALNDEFALDPNSLHIWPREEFMVIALPNPDKTFTVTLFMKAKGQPSFESIDSPKKLLSFFMSEFPDLVKLIPDLTQSFFKNPTGNLGTVKCLPWIYEDSAFLIGDAAHAIVPFHGQGMNCGFEDCEQFISLLDSGNYPNFSDLLTEYQTLRKPNGDAIADLAIDNYKVMRSSVVDPKFQAKKEIGFILEREFSGKFVPRYSRVMFTHIPYAEAMRLGELQEKILDELVEGFTRTKQVDMEKARSLIEKHLR